MGQIRKGEYCPGCGQVCDGRHLDKELRPPTEVIHRCPPIGSGIMPCCSRTPFEVPLWHRITEDPALVTCRSDRAQR
jgi:hypothetical protein